MFLTSLIYEDLTCIVYRTPFLKFCPLPSPSSFCYLVSLAECVNTPQLILFNDIDLVVEPCYLSTSSTLPCVMQQGIEFIAGLIRIAWCLLLL